MEQKSSIYETPSIVIVNLVTEDIITMSPGSDNDGNIPEGWIQ